VLGCNIAFATPISSPPITLTLVGGYRFNDYIKVGGILTVLAASLTAMAVPMLYGL
jgi:di/tricarboxylate transporter